jgi:hypothetical protein
MSAMNDALRMTGGRGYPAIEVQLGTVLRNIKDLAARGADKP